jgi:hypothetical protein
MQNISHTVYRLFPLLCISRGSIVKPACVLLLVLATIRKPLNSRSHQELTIYKLNITQNFD